MFNSSFTVAALDHRITLNWDDGPTLMRIEGQARYRMDESSAHLSLRVTAASVVCDEPLCVESRNAALRAVWAWRAADAGCVAQLTLSNIGVEDVLVESCDLLRIDALYGGLFNVGAPPGLWRVLNPGGHARAAAGWQAWAGAPFERDQMLLISPSASNRSAGTALRFRVLPGESARPVRFMLQTSGERFERFSALCMLEEMRLAPGAAWTSPEIEIACGDDAGELAALS